MNIILRKRNVFAIITIIAFVCVINYRWFGFDYFTYGDWHYKFNTGLKDYLNPSVWTGASGYGGQDASFWRLPLNTLFGIFAYFKVPFNISEKIIVFWPTIIGLAAAGYYFAKKIAFNRTAGVIGAIILSFNSYTIASVGQGHILLLTATFLAILGILSILGAIEKKYELKLYIISALLFTASGWVDLRILYLSFGFIALYLIYASIFEKIKIKDIALGLITFGTIIILLNAFWVLPAVASGGVSSNSVLSRGLFGNNFWNIYSSITFTHPFWGMQYTTWFMKQDVALYLWLLPILYIVSLIAYRKLNKKLVFFGLIGIIGILLSKQVDEPFTGLYSWLFNNVPGFNAFRESTKFYFYSILGLIALMSVYTVKLKHEGNLIKTLRYTSITMVIIIFSINAFAIVSGSVGKLYSKKEIPKDYSTLESFLSTKPGFYRTLWTPTTTRWNLSTADTPTITGSVLSKTWGGYISDADLDTLNDEAVLTKLSLLLKSDNGHDILNRSSIRYIVVPLGAADNGDDLYTNYEGNRDDYVELLNGLSYLSKLDIGTDELVVYENKSYYPLVSTEDKAYAINDTENPAMISSFLNNVSNAKPIYVHKNSNQNTLPVAQNLFSTPIIDDQSDILRLSDSIDTYAATDAVLYRDTGNSDLWYSVDESSLNIFTHAAQTPKLNDSVLASVSQETQIIKSIDLEPGETYFLRVNDTLAKLFEGTTEYIGSAADIHSIDVLRQGTNTLINGSFENGAWQNYVGDCNNYDNMGNITMGIDDSAASDGEKSLRLEATRHNACTSTDIDITPDKNYLLTFDYNSIHSDYIGYYLEFNNGEKTAISLKKSVHMNGGWETQAINVHTPANSSSVRLYLYSYESNSQENNIVLYDNVTFSTPVTIDNVDLSVLNEKFEAVEVNLSEGVSQFELEFPDYTNANIINNGSFEDGAWTGTVGDCNNYDGNPSISMGLSATATNGTHSLLLEAERHDACTSTNIFLGEAGSAILSFDYLPNNKNKFGYRIIFNDNANTTISDTISSDKPNQWGYYQKLLKAPFGSSVATLYLYTYESDGRTNNSILFDNFKLIKTPNIEGRYFLVSGDNTALVNPKQVTLSNVSASKTTTYIHNQSQPSILNFGQAFDPNWKIFLEPVTSKAPCISESNNRSEYSFDETEYIECDKVGPVGFGDINYTANKFVLPASYHYMVNGYANGWLLDPEYIKDSYPRQLWEMNDDGSINVKLTIYYQPQSYFYIGAIISSITLLSTIFYIAWRNIRHGGQSRIIYSVRGKRG